MSSPTFARTSSIVNGRPTSWPIGAPERIRCGSAADVVVVAVREHDGRDRQAGEVRDVGQELLDGAADGAARAAREADAAVDDEARVAPLDTVRLRPTSPTPPRGRIRSTGSTGGNVDARPVVGAGVRYWRPSGVWRSLVARSVRVGEVPSSNLGTPMRFRSRSTGSRAAVGSGHDGAVRPRVRRALRAAGGHRAGAARCRSRSRPAAPSRLGPAAARRHRRRRGRDRRRHAPRRATPSTSPPSRRPCSRSPASPRCACGCSRSRRCRRSSSPGAAPAAPRTSASTSPIALACATLAWLTGAVAPRRALAVGIVAAAVVDVYQVLVTEQVQVVARALHEAAPPRGLPPLQEAVYAGRLDGLRRPLPRRAARGRARDERGAGAPRGRRGGARPRRRRGLPVPACSTRSRRRCRSRSRCSAPSPSSAARRCATRGSRPRPRATLHPRTSGVHDGSGRPSASLA